MQVTETTNEGLKRELKVVIAANELDDKLEARLADLKEKVNIKGFRPGKVPVTHLRKMYGRSVMAEILQESVNETSRNALKDREERPAYDPEISLTEDKEEIDQIMDGKADLSYTMSFEILPEIELHDFSTYKLEKVTAEVTEEEHTKGIEKVLENQAKYVAVERGAQDKDRVKIDFVGKVDGEKFEGGAAEGVPLELGSGQFIDGFEEGLKGKKAGDEVEINCTFPKDYQQESLAGKEAVFEVKVHEVTEPQIPELDGELVKALNFETVDEFKEAVKEKLQEELNGVSKSRLKKDLLDELDETHKFELPEKLVTQEFDQIWAQITADLATQNQSLEDQGKNEEEERAKFKDIAARRVRLGLVVSEIGTKNDIKVSDEDVQQELINKAGQYPGQERQVLSYYQQNPQALAEIRAPLFEEKVMDFLLEMATITEKSVSIEELTKFEDEADPDAQ